MVKLSKRLARIADKVPRDSRLADIGTDHALLPVALVEEGKIRYAVAGEINPGPLQAAEKQVREAGLSDNIRVRRGDGLAVLSPGEADVIVLAGMGGSLIAEILNAGFPKLSGVKRLILQPNIGGEWVRRWLADHQWALTEEDIVEEDGKIYEIMVADRMEEAAAYNRRLYRDRLLCGSVAAKRDILLLMGPHLIERPTEIWFRKWQGELAKMSMIIDQISLSGSEAAARKRAEMKHQANMIREVLECLRKGKPSFN